MGYYFLFFILFILSISTPAQTNFKNDFSEKKYSKNHYGDEITKKTLATKKFLSEEKEKIGTFAKTKSSLLPGEKNDINNVPPVIYRLQRGEKEVSVEFGVSPFNPSNFAGPKEYDVYGRDLYQANIRIGRVIGTKGAVTYQYLFGVTPLAIFTENEVKNPAYISQETTPEIEPTKRETTYGIGIQPVNFRFIFLPENRWKPYAQVGAGILFTNKAVPVPRSQPFNFTGDFGGGVQYFASRKKAVSFGYRYFHISNGNVGGRINNPGYNANVFYLNYSFFWK